MPDVNLDVLGTVALADEIVTLLVHTILLDGLDLHVQEVSQCTVLYHLVRCSSHKISSALHVLLGTSSLPQNLCRC